jgi:hypothetical protein
MKTPDWKNCTEEELWHFVGFHLAKAGLESVLVGGAVVSVYSKGAYRSGDLDFITTRGSNAEVQQVLETIGFEKIRGRHYEHPKCKHLIIEFPPGPISIGDDYKIQPKEVTFEGQTIKIFNPTDCIRDRLASYIHFQARECLDQAVLVAQNQPFDLNKVKKWCISEGAQEIFEDFKQKIKLTKNVEGKE